MGFYQSIAPYYDVIFPFDEDQTAFLSAVLDDPALPVGRTGFLDMGCGTGTLLASFTGRFEKLIGVDIDAELLSYASAKFPAGVRSRVELLKESIRDLDVLFRDEEFSCITCLGNTLPHLVSPGAIPETLKSTARHLESDGVFVFQTINYDRILDLDLRGLPTIERDDITFERYYSAPDERGLISFSTILSDPGKNLEVKSSIPLLPVRKAQMEDYLSSAGFSRISFFGDYAGAVYGAESYLLIGVCRI